MSEKKLKILKELLIVEVEMEGLKQSSNVKVDLADNQIVLEGEVYGNKYVNIDSLKREAIKWIKELEAFQDSLPYKIDTKREKEALEKYSHLKDFWTEYEHEAFDFYDVQGLINWIKHFFVIRLLNEIIKNPKLLEAKE